MFTEREQEYLLEVLEIEHCGLQSARQLTEEDDSLGSLDNLLEVMSGYEEKEQLLRTIREKVQNDGRQGSYASNVRALLQGLLRYARGS